MRRFGLIGRTLAYSFSGEYFASKFVNEGITDARYDLFEMPDVNSLREWGRSVPELVGLNVTIPFKEDVIKHLDDLSDTARSIGAVNTILINNDQWTGHNTDAFGFKESIKPVFRGHHDRAIILGTGGASKAVQHALHELGVECVFASRKPQHSNEVAYEELDGEGFEYFKLIVNTTPLGTHPNIDQCPPIPFHRITDRHLLVDLVYNPATTLFMREGAKRGASVMNGKDMLRFQAEKAWEIWNNKDSLQSKGT
ncbi:MAG: shikimate dehydrogenase [Flavobacteriales bacterium]|nr:shikimate dehydrogenase [Flavobacteriales bacterium]